MKYNSNTISPVNRFVFVTSIFMMMGYHNVLTQVLNNQSQKERIYCSLPTYPCYYYLCSQLTYGTDITKLTPHKCPKSMIFDDIEQNCIVGLPWQICPENDDINQPQNNMNYMNEAKITENNMNEANKKNKPSNNLISETKTVELNKQGQPADMSRDYLYKILANFGKDSSKNFNSGTTFHSETNKINLTYLSINEANLNIKSEKVLLHEDAGELELPNTNYQSQNHYTNKSLIENDEEVDLNNNSNDEYAFIIVPIKLDSKHHQHQKPIIPKTSIKPTRPTTTPALSQSTIPKSTQPVVDDNLKKYQNMFQYKKVCYVTNWSQYRPKPGYFSPEFIDPFLCTHIIFAFAYIDNVTLTIKTIEENDEDMYRKLNNLKIKNPKLKTMLGVGGWNMEADEFSAMVREKKSRMVFIYHAIKFIRYHGFDGIDLDWEFPGDLERGGHVYDKEKLTIFIKELRQAINDEPLEEKAERLIFSAAVAAGKTRIDSGYEIAQISAELDFINLMAFDFHGSWDAKTGLNAPLYSNENETAEESMLNQDWSVNYWITNGCPPYKLILGVPAYGRTFTLKDSKENGLGAATIGSGTSGNFTKSSGFLSFYECCALRKTKDWTTVWLSQSKSHYMFNKNQWVSFDDIKSFHLRTAYIVAKKLGGLFIWSLDMDDFSGKFCEMGPYPLIKNSMSLLMDYMPEYYSSNVNAEPKGEVKNIEADPVPSNMIYILKENDEIVKSVSGPFLPLIQNTTYNDNQSKVKSIQNQIQNDLLLLLKLQPQNFLSYSLKETFNCSSKQSGIHRDPINCNKYYYCNSLANNNKSQLSILLETKTFSCPPNTKFNMNGCFCDENLHHCDYLQETLCISLSSMQQSNFNNYG